MTWTGPRGHDPPNYAVSKPDYVAVWLAYMREQLGRPIPPRHPHEVCHRCPVHCPDPDLVHPNQLSLLEEPTDAP